MAQFGGYGFNKSHSAAYALVAYQTAYLKAHHPVQFMAALLTVEKEVTDNVVKYVNECREMGIQVHPPDINRSGLDFTVEGDSVRFGLGAIKNVGDGSIESILAARERVGSFASLSQLCREVESRSLNRKGAGVPGQERGPGSLRVLKGRPDAVPGRLRGRRPEGGSGPGRGAGEPLRGRGSPAGSGSGVRFRGGRMDRPGASHLREGNPGLLRERSSAPGASATLEALRGTTTRGLAPEAAGRSVHLGGWSRP